MKSMGLIVLMVLPGLTACTANNTNTMLAATEGQQCTEPRPEVCTRDYRPVCANLNDGSQKTYSNGCGACTGANADSWVAGECAD
jgi:hypothetical protein